MRIAHGLLSQILQLTGLETGPAPTVWAAPDSWHCDCICARGVPAAGVTRREGGEPSVLRHGAPVTPNLLMVSAGVFAEQQVMLL